MYGIDEENPPTECTDVYFWPKTLDDRCHPNDYLKLEDKYKEFEVEKSDDQELKDQKLELKWLFSTCCGMIEIADIFKTVEQLSGEKPFVFTPEAIKLKKVILEFREENCQHKHQENNNACRNRHYFIGIGEYITDAGVIYCGIHIVPYPVQDLEQDKQTYGLADIKDPIYSKYLDWMQKNPNATEDEVNQQKNELSELYLNQFHKLFMKAPKFIKKEKEISEE